MSMKVFKIVELYGISRLICSVGLLWMWCPEQHNVQSVPRNSQEWADGQANKNILHPLKKIMFKESNMSP